MGNYLQYADFAEKLQMPENQQYDANMKCHQKNPQEGFVFADGGKQKRIVQRPQPRGFFLRIDLKRGRMFGRAKDVDQTDGCAGNKNGKGKVDHRHQDDVIQRFQIYLPLDYRSGFK